MPTFVHARHAPQLTLTARRTTGRWGRALAGTAVLHRRPGSPRARAFESWRRQCGQRWETALRQLGTRDQRQHRRSVNGTEDGGGGHRTRPLGIIALAVCAALLASCGTSQSASPIKGTCQEVSAVLSDGPDPGADPVGYAFAQILPLRQITTSDTPLQAAIDSLAAAYQKFYDDNGTGEAAKHAVNQASDKINALCPGAAS